jgi:hypothetical protein
MIVHGTPFTRKHAAVAIPEIATGVMQLIGCSYGRHDHHSCR